MKRRWLIRVFVLGALLAFAVWLEPTRVVWGWLRGEAFYQGRPTSWWAQQLLAWEHFEFRWWRTPRLEEEEPTTWYFQHKPTPFDRWLRKHCSMAAPEFPRVLLDDPETRPVLRELANQPDQHVAEIARQRLHGTKMGRVRIHGGLGPGAF